jgi:hypothetical protein
MLKKCKRMLMKSLKRKSRRYHLNETIEDKINKKIGKSSLRAFRNARKKALKQGLSVVVKIEDSLYKIYPSGEREFIKKVAPDVEVNRKSFQISL